jgi:hypothetical protein
VMVGTRGVWRGGTIADLCLPRVRVGCRGVRSGVDAHTNPGTSIGCNRMPRCRGKAKSWPYRPKGTIGPGSRDCIPGWWNWPYRPQSQGQRLRVCTHFASTIFEGDDAFAVPGHARFRSSRLRALCIHGGCPACGPRAFAAHPRFRPVRPAPSAWREMPGHASPRRRRPARAVLSRTPPCDGWYAWGVARRGHRGFVVAAGAFWLPRCTFRRRCAYEPRHVGRMQPNAALPGRG